MYLLNKIPKLFRYILIPIIIPFILLWLLIEWGTNKK